MGRLSVLRATAAAALSLFCAAFLPAQDSAPDPGSEDAVTQAAVRAALLGQRGELARLTRSRQAWEETQAEGVPHLSDELAALALAANRPLPTARQARAVLNDFGPATPQARAVERSLASLEEEERYRLARSTRIYAHRTGWVDEVFGLTTAVVTLRWWQLITFPLEVVEYTVIGRPYVDPLQRRELSAAQQVEAATEEAGGAAAEEKTRERAAEAVRKLTERRQRLFMLQARANAERAEEQGRLHTGDWWYRREMALSNSQEPISEDHRELLRTLREMEQRREASRSVGAGENQLAAEDRDSYRALLRQVLLDSGSARTDRMADAFVRENPSSPAADEAYLARAMVKTHTEQREDAARLLENLGEARPALWEERAEFYRTRPRVLPEVAFDEARGAIRQRFREYLLQGRDPRIVHRHYTAEEARRLESSFIRAARRLFYPDILGRLIALPFLDPFPRQELYEATAQAPPAYFRTPQGREDLQDVAEALETERRWTQAAETWRRLQMPQEEQEAVRRAARALEKEADKEQDPAEKVVLYRRLLNAYDDYPKRERVTEKLLEATQDRDLIATVTRSELRAYSSLRETLQIPDVLLDGARGNGEVGKDGVRLLRDGMITYEDRATGQQVQQQVGEARAAHTLDLLRPRRRQTTIAEVLENPISGIPAIPLAIEGSLLPGFDVAPSLAPATADRQEMRLYE